ncbi:MAG: NUDIX domain-containing protein [Actinophytocola sp.]|uniref:NUDIX domain-containing protein n=1 Tax=Actinophytocola sp. TaxID=1872138 RepID=UPI003C7143B3
MPRPGFGTRHPGLVDVLSRLTPSARQHIVWPGEIALRVAAYLTPAELPDELITSIRCIVRVGDRVVVCHAPDEQHIWPGGRREPGETYEQTARREVHEETGWLIDPGDLRPLGFLHLQLTEPRPHDHPYPHPDFLQLVYTAPARHHADHPAGWVDLDGWERGHRLLPPGELATVPLTAVQRAFLDVLR